MRIEMGWLDYRNSRGKQCRKLQFREAYYENWREVPIVSEEKQDEYRTDKDNT